MLTWLCRLLGLGGLALMGATWKLWTPQEVFPRVPLLYWAPPHWFDWTALVITVAGLLGLMITPSRPGRTVTAIITTCGYALLFLSDQHRLQPWAWQFFLVAILLAIADDRWIVTGWRWLVISIYVYSALSKFDVAFVESWGAYLNRLFAPEMASWQAPTNSWSQFYLKQILPWSLPAGELFVALLLMNPRIRRYGLCGSWLMHLGLLGILGPLGLNHSWGVIGWNLFFLVQNLCLWWESLPLPALSNAPVIPASAWRYKLTRGYLILILAYPVLYPVGILDAWLGWAVYAPPFRGVRLTYDYRTRQQIRGGARLGVRDDGIEFDPRHLRVPDIDPLFYPEDWSLQALGVPCYPSPRFHTAVVMDVIERDALHEFDFATYHRPSRGQYDMLPVEPSLHTRDQLWHYAAGFWFNAYPESVYRRE